MNTLRDENQQSLRRSRESFERTLRKILQKVNASESVNLEWSDSFLRKRELTGLAFPKALWVAGSFARGAAYCGDLDLVLEVELQCTYQPAHKVVTKHIVGSYPDVRTYVGTPAENSSHVAFEEARLLWSKEYPNWEEALTKITVAEGGGRFSRETDCIPLRSEQYDCEDPKEIVRLQQEGILEWEWIPLESLPDELDELSEKYLARVTRSRARKYTDLFRNVLGWAGGREPEITCQPYVYKNSPIRLGSVEVVIGPCPNVLPERLDSIAVSSRAIVPYKTRRGPNGMWLIHRGPNHQLVKAFDAIQTHVMAGTDGAPQIIDSGRYDRCLQCWLSLTPKDGYLAVSGGDLLRILSQVESVRVGRREFKYSQYVKTDDEENLIKYLRKGYSYFV